MLLVAAARHAKVGQLDVAVAREQDVGGLHVAMHHAATVQVLEPV